MNFKYFNFFLICQQLFNRRINPTHFVEQVFDQNNLEAEAKFYYKLYFRIFFNLKRAQFWGMGCIANRREPQTAYFESRYVKIVGVGLWLKI